MNDNRKIIIQHMQEMQQLTKRINEQDAELQILRKMMQTYKQLLDLAAKQLHKTKEKHEND